MALFQYPKSKHVRRLSPRRFKNYRSYKRYLQIEFTRICVYCRQPDSSAPNLNFGVDHYRPKSVSRFANLVCDYTNLYYCCGNCNSRKREFWPKDEEQGPFIVAPCEHEMASHLRFNKETGLVNARTVYGEFTIELLQLNEEATVQWRLGSLRTIQMYENEIKKHNEFLKNASRSLQCGKISQDQFNNETQPIYQELSELQRIMQSITGELSLPLLPQNRLGVNLFA